MKSKVPEDLCASFHEIFKISEIRFEFGPLKLNTYHYVFDGLKYIWSHSGLSKELHEEPDESFLLLTNIDENVHNFCMRIFSSEPISSSLPVECFLRETRDKPLLVYVSDLCHLLKERRSFISTALDRNAGLVYFVLDENVKQEDLKFLDLEKASGDIIHKDEDMTKFYEGCYRLVSRKVSEYVDTLSLKPRTRNITKCLKLLEKYKESIVATTLPVSMNNNAKTFSDKLDAFVDKSPPKYEVLGYALYEDVLKIFAGPGIKSATKEMLDTFLRELRVQCGFSGRVLLQILKSPYFTPQALVQGGCGINTGTFSGTLGMFANYLEKKESQMVAISSGHVAVEGNDVHVNSEGVITEIGRCIWPIASINAMTANIEDISVITLKEGIDRQICYRMPSRVVKLREIELSDLNNRKVFKFGAITGETKGYLKCAKKSKLMGAEVMFIEPDVKENITFSEQGDSGAIVFTKIDPYLIALGVVFGGNLKIENSDSDEDNLSEDTNDLCCIAVDLKRSIERFHAAKGVLSLERF